MKKSFKALLSLALSAMMLTAALPTAMAADASTSIVKENFDWKNWKDPDAAWRNFMEGTAYNVGPASTWNSFSGFVYRADGDIKHWIRDGAVTADDGKYSIASEMYVVANGNGGEKAAIPTVGGKAWGYAGHNYLNLSNVQESKVTPEQWEYVKDRWHGFSDISDYIDNGYAVFKVVSKPVNVNNAYFAITAVTDNWQFHFNPTVEGNWPVSYETHKDIPWKHYAEIVKGVKFTDYYDMEAGGVQTVVIPLNKLVNDADFEEYFSASIDSLKNTFTPREKHNMNLELFSGMGIAKQESGGTESMEVRMGELKIIALPVPQNVKASANDNAVTVSWDAVAESGVTYKVARIAGGEKKYIADGLTKTSFTDTVSASGTYEYVVETYSSEYGVGSPESAKATVDVVSSVVLNPADLVLEDIDITGDVETEIENIFVGHLYAQSDGTVSEYQFDELNATSSIRENNVKIGKRFWINDFGHDNDFVGRQITFRPTAPGQYTATRTNSSGKLYEADGYVERYVGENWGYAGFGYRNSAFKGEVQDMSGAKGGYAVFTIDIAKGSCVDNAYLAFTYIDTTSNPALISGSIENHRGIIVVGAPLEDYYDTTKMGKQTVCVPLSAFEFSENDDAFVGVATANTRASYAYYTDRANWLKTQKIQFANFAGMGIARNDVNADKVEGFEFGLYEGKIVADPGVAMVLTADGNTLKWNASGYSDTTYEITKTKDGVTETINVGTATSYADAADGYTYTVAAVLGDTGVKVASAPVTLGSEGGDVVDPEPPVIPDPEPPVVPDEPEEDEEELVTVETIDWANWLMPGAEYQSYMDCRSIYTSSVDGTNADINQGPTNTWNDYQWWCGGANRWELIINDTGFSADNAGDIAKYTYLKNAEGNKEYMEVPTSDGVKWAYRGSQYAIGSSRPANWPTDRLLGVKDISKYENNGYFVFDVKVDSADYDMENAYLAIEVLTDNKAFGVDGLTEVNLPVTAEEYGDKAAAKWEPKTTFIIGVPLTKYYDTTKMGQQKVYVPISEFTNNPEFKEMYSKSTSSTAATFAEKLGYATDLRMFMGMGIAKKNSKDFETNPKEFKIKVYGLSIEAKPVKEPTVSITEVNLGDYAGKAWDVVVSNFDAAKDYIASFVDGEESKTGEIGFDNVEADGGSVAFAIFLHTSRANVALDIAVQ